MIWLKAAELQLGFKVVDDAVMQTALESLDNRPMLSQFWNTPNVHRKDWGFRVARPATCHESKSPKRNSWYMCGF